MLVELYNRLNSAIMMRLYIHNREKKRWRVNLSNNHEANVFYGIDEIPCRNMKVAGGIIKFQDLQSVYPNTMYGANIIYLVTSALPPYADLIASIAKKNGCRIVINQNGVAYPGCYPSGWRRMNRPMRKLMRMADHIFYQSEFCLKAARIFLGEYNCSSDILYNPVDTNVFVPASQRAFTGHTRLLLAGSHCDYYRVSTAIEAFAYLIEAGVNCSLIVAGRYCWRTCEVDALAEARHLAKQLRVDDRVFFKGSYTQMDAPNLFRNAEILLHTKYNDPCPRLVVEGMSCGLPVVYSGSGGVPELVGENAGAGVPAPCDWSSSHPPEPSLLANCVMQILANYSTYSAAARKRAVDLFDVKPWVEKHREVFENLAAKHLRS